jgi:hypothetical protein
VNGSSITGYTAISIGSQIYDSPASGPNVSLADTFQASTPFASGGENDYPTLMQGLPLIGGYPGGPPGVGVIPFFWAKGNATSEASYAAFTNISPLQARLLLALGELPLSFFTGNAADGATDVILVGCSNVAGIRDEIEADADFGFGQGTENQYQPIL